MNNKEQMPEKQRKFAIFSVITRFVRWGKLDKIKYFDNTGMYLFGFEVAGGLSMIITGFLFSGLMSLANDTGYWLVGFIPFGLLIVIPPIIWIVGFIRALVNVL